jgi:hypothetical protein
VSECKSCGGRLIWATTKAGETIPLNAERVEPGANRFLLVQSETPGNPIALAASVWAKLEPVGTVRPSLYVSHFSTCPDSEKFRK